MPGRIVRRLRFMLERWIQRGAFFQLLLMLGLIALVACGGGLLAWFVTDEFGSAGSAVWWAFLRLTDPGYLGDDDGTTLRSISTVVTVLGYVLFMGSLIAIMTQWLNQKIRILESGLSPISISNHVLILGWTSRTPSIVRELVLSEGRVRRFLDRRRAGARLKIVILCDVVGSGLRQEIRDLLGPKLDRVTILLRSGSSMRLDHLERVNFRQAAAIILPGADFLLGGPDVTDTRVVKSLMTISPAAEWNMGAGDVPAVVAEIFDADKLEIAEKAYNGPLSVIAGDAFISRLIVQTIRHRGLSTVYSELLSHERGNEVYIRQLPDLAGRRFADLANNLPNAIPIGVVRDTPRGLRSMLNPEGDMTLERDDRVIMLAEQFEDCVPRRTRSGETDLEVRTNPSFVAPAKTQSLRRILVLGWSHKVNALLTELCGYDSETFVVDLLSLVPIAEREADLSRLDTVGRGVEVRHLQGDYTRKSQLEAIEWELYDNIVLLGSDWLHSSEETDARSILGYTGVHAMLDQRGGRRPDILVELLDSSNARLFRDRVGEIIVSPAVLSHMLAHAALRHELTSVFEEMFGPGGSEIFFRPVTDFGLENTSHTFTEIQRVVGACGAVAIGVRPVAASPDSVPRPRLNPGADSRWSFGMHDEIVVLTHYT